MVLNQVKGRSPAQLKYVTLTYDEMVEVMWDHFYSIGMNVPIKDNFYCSLFLTGQRSLCAPTPNYLLPPYLTREGFDKLKVIISC